MRHRISALLVVAAFVGAGTTAQAAPAATVGGAAKKCSAGYKKASINGSSKCLKTGQLCSIGAKAQYSRHGFKCRRGSDGRNRLFKK